MTNPYTPSDRCPFFSERPVGAKNSRVAFGLGGINSPFRMPPVIFSSDAMSARRAVTSAPACVLNTTSTSSSRSMVPYMREPSRRTSSWVVTTLRELACAPALVFATAACAEAANRMHPMNIAARFIMVSSQSRVPSRAR